MELIKGSCKVEWIELGEGWSGDYNPDDPEDEELLRFDVYVFDKDYCTCGRIPCTCGGEWVDPGDVSYCTAFPVETSDELKEKALHLIIDRLYDQPVSYWKKICEELLTGSNQRGFKLDMWKRVKIHKWTFCRYCQRCVYCEVVWTLGNKYYVCQTCYEKGG